MTEQKLADLQRRVAALEAWKKQVESRFSDEGLDAAPDLLGGVATVDGKPDWPELVRQAVALWNVMAADAKMPQANPKKISAPRSHAIKRCLKQAGGLDGWKYALGQVAGNAHLRGINDRKWKADLEFITREVKFTKLMEGGYPNDYGKQGGIGPNGRGASRDDIRSGVLQSVADAGGLEPGKR